jgi:hypothetical protein
MLDVHTERTQTIYYRQALCRVLLLEKQIARYILLGLLEETKGLLGKFVFNMQIVV